MKKNNSDTEKTNGKNKTSLEVFIDSLDENERQLLSSYVAKKSYETLSETFDQTLNSR